MDNWEIEIISRNHVTLEHIKGTDNILVDSISCLRSIHLCDSIDLEVEEKEFGHDIFEKVPPLMQKTPSGRKMK